MQISCGRKVYFHRNHMTQPLVDLVIVGIPEGLPVHGLCDLDHVVPPWNARNNMANALASRPNKVYYNRIIYDVRVKQYLDLSASEC